MSRLTHVLWHWLGAVGVNWNFQWLSQIWKSVEVRGPLGWPQIVTTGAAEPSAGCPRASRTTGSAQVRPSCAAGTTQGWIFWETCQTHPNASKGHMTNFTSRFCRTFFQGGVFMFMRSLASWVRIEFGYSGTTKYMNTVFLMMTCSHSRR